MKIIAIKLLCIGLYVLLLYFSAAYLVYYNINGEFESSRQVNYKLSLLKQAASPRIIVVGGSNTIYGIDCKRLSELTGYRVINIGLTANIGIRFGLESLRQYLKKGDIVLISPEYENFFNNNIYYGNDTVAFLTTKHPESLSSSYITSWQQLSSVLGKLPYITFRHFYIHELLGKTTISDAEYNEFGDMQIDNIAITGKMFAEKRFICGQSTLNNNVIKELVKYHQAAIINGARLLIAYPFIPEETYKLNRKKLDSLHNKLISAGLETIAPPSESFAAKIYFNDTIYHPNPVGRVLRTDAIFQGINKYIHTEENNAPTKLSKQPMNEAAEFTALRKSRGSYLKSKG